MDKEKILLRLSAQVNTLKAHIKRLQKQDDEIHSMDMDIMRKNILELYEMIFELNNISESRVKNEIKKEDDIDITNTVITDNQTNDIGSENIVTDKQEVSKGNHPEANQEEVLLHSVVEEKVKEPKVDNLLSDDTPIQDEVKNEEPLAQTAYDLFSTTSEDAVSKQFASGEEQSVGEKMQKTQVENIREAIGINEKFLFINELFNGDMTRYNKILDEINELTTNKGVETYILELKVQSQWGDDNEAYHKLKELCARKLNQ